MRAALLLLRKDALLLRRSPALMLVLIVYPILVALLVAVALQSDERRPDVAVVNLDTSGRTVDVAGNRLSVDDYIDRLAQDVDVRRLGPAAAAAALDAGRVSAVLTIPEGFIADLQSGVRQPALQLAASRRSPIEAQAITRRLEAAVYRLNQRLATGYVQQVLELVDLVTNGGQIGIFGRTGDALGLKRSRTLVTGLQSRLRASGDGRTAAQLGPLVNFIDETQRNLDLAKPAANAIRAPIALEVTEGAAGREPLSAFGFAGALLVSLGLAGTLLAAAAMSSEREDGALVRLRRGLVSAGGLVGEKMAFTAVACLVVGLALLGGVALATDLTVGRWGLWIGVLLLAGLAFGAFGVLAGALARETRSALLIALMVALPLMALGLVPNSGVAHAVSEVVPFGPAFDAFQTLLVEPTIDAGDLLLTLGQLALIGAVLAVAAAVAVRRRPAV
ncbi:MAG TPA: ABC transporter permease [Miltoncostaea sp.]|nr:ABC transporter permease [Miltoncostaea sp.]